MKKLIILILIMNSFLLMGQENINKKSLVSNDSNFSLSPFRSIDLKKKKSKHTINLRMSNVGLGKYYNKNVAEILKIDKYTLNTALEFELEGDSLHYYYPIDTKKFNWVYYEKNISQKKGVQKVKLCVIIFKTDKTPIVIIDSIKRLE